ncbi:unnamed protein product [Auanema sp. JU1783]|nr:unnamed protein product [Auanema sp. JU1783]
MQIKAGKELLTFNDVIVESPTGSGKTLSFLLPLFTLLKNRTKLEKLDIGALIVSPSRELAKQIANVAKPYADALGYTIGTAIGGSKSENSYKSLIKNGGNILIATPGRLYQVLEMDKDEKIQRRLKKLEVFIADEADRFNETQFEVHIKAILAAIPRQRRTGLFSATQAKEKSDLAVFSLRNAKTIKLRENNDTVAPSSLNNFYTVCEAAEKLMCAIEFIRNHKDKKILLFFPSCCGVVYFRAILEHVKLKRKIFAVHGKSSQKQRTDEIANFRKNDNSIMLSTDVMSRGIDIEDIDWVIQFEIPKLSSWFIHRAGRTARCGREGNALLILTPQQTAYTQFLETHEKVALKELHVKTSNADKAKQLREKIIKMACADRSFLEKGTKAFVSHIESYVKHDCNVVCGLKALDVPGLAHCYGILRLPKMRELSERADLSKFERSEIDTSTIPYLNEKMEAKREEIMKVKHDKRVAFKKQKAIDLAEKNKRMNKGKEPPKKLTKEEKAKAEKDEKNLKRKATKEAQKERDDFESDVQLIRKMKRGRLSRKEMNDLRI